MTGSPQSIKSHSKLTFCPVTLQMRDKPSSEVSASHVRRNTVPVPTCAVCSSGEDVEGGLQTLNQAEPRGDTLLAQHRVAAQEHFLDAATKRAGKGLVLPSHRFYPEQVETHKHFNISM